MLLREWVGATAGARVEATRAAARTTKERATECQCTKRPRRPRPAIAARYNDLRQRSRTSTSKVQAVAATAARPDAFRDPETRTRARRGPPRSRDAPVAVVAFGAISALGEGAAAAHGELAGRARVDRHRARRGARGRGLARPFVARVRLVEGREIDRAPRLLRSAPRCAARETSIASRPGWRGAPRRPRARHVERRDARRGAALRARGRRADASRRPSAPRTSGRSLGCAASLGVALRAVHRWCSAACASSALAIGLACRWLERGACDVVLAGGFDDVTVFVGAGFEALRAITAAPPPRPFRVGRDGMALGRGGGGARAGLAGRGAARVFVTGFAAASADAVHLTAPDRQGAGARARGHARPSTRPGDPRGRPRERARTATPFNDAAEARAHRATSLGAERGRVVVVHPFKAQIGPRARAPDRRSSSSRARRDRARRAPRGLRRGRDRPETPRVRLLARAERGAPADRAEARRGLRGRERGARRHVVARAGGGATRLRPVYLHQAATDRRRARDRGARGGARLCSADRLARADGLVRLALAAVARAARGHGRSRRRGRRGRDAPSRRSRPTRRSPRASGSAARSLRRAASLPVHVAERGRRASARSPSASPARASRSAGGCTRRSRRSRRRRCSSRQVTSTGSLSSRPMTWAPPRARSDSLASGRAPSRCSSTPSDRPGARPGGRPPDRAMRRRGSRRARRPGSASAGGHRRRRRAHGALAARRRAGAVRARVGVAGRPGAGRFRGRLTLRQAARNGARRQ